MLYVGYLNDSNRDSVLRHRYRLCPGLRPAVAEKTPRGGRQMIESTLLILVIALLMAYLVYALLRPEKF